MSSRFVQVMAVVGAVVVSTGCGDRDRKGAGGTGPIGIVSFGNPPSAPRPDSGVLPVGRDVGPIDPPTGDAGCSECQSNSGVDPSKVLSDLTSGEIATLCAWMESQQGGARSVTCEFQGSPVTINVKSAAECAQADYSSATGCTVGDSEDCMLSLEGDPCQFFVSTACQAFLACMGGE